MFAAVDLGSNSFRLHIGKHDGDAIKIVKSARDPIRLGAGIDADGNFTPQAMDVAEQSLQRFAELLSGYRLDAVRVVATNAMRIARNAAEFLPRAERAIGYPIEVISGEEEGRLIYFGVACSVAVPTERRLVLDIGGGSSELVLGAGQEIEIVESFSIGTVPQNQAFFASGVIDDAAFDAAVLSARGRFEDAAPLYRARGWQRAYGSSGTIRAIAEAIARNQIGDGRLTRASAERLRERLVAFGDSRRIVLAGLKPDRATVIVGGLSVLIGVMDELGIDEMLPIEAGLRMGVLWDLQLRATRRDRRESSVRAFMQRFGVDPGRAERVADIAGALYAALKPASPTFAKALGWGALLHETGLAVSHSGYHKHGAYLVEHADLPGFTSREQRAMSLLVLGHKGNLRKLNGNLSEPDFAKALLALRLAVLLMHARIDVSPGSLKLRMKKGIDFEIDRAWLNEHPTLGFWLEQERQHWKDAGVEMQLKPA
jgi:exopolyphosphatase/guanosine-5'-triphosphate,3'-diphosphate pyrophosphatase